MKELLQNNWPFALLLLWFGYKWWRARQVVSMLPALRQAGAVLVDVRTLDEFASANAPGTLNIPLQELGTRLHEIPRGVPVVVGCASGTRSGMARMMLRKNGYAPVYNIGTWRNFLK
jgi:phage shock protein E